MEFYDEVIEIKKTPKTNRSNSKEKGMSSAVKGESSAPIVPQSIDDSSRTTTKRPGSSLPRKSAQHAVHAASDTESSDSESEKNAENLAEGFNYKQWENLNVSSEIKDIYQYIAKYSPAKIDITYRLQPFIPDFIPAVGDIDAFLKVIPPKPFYENSKIHEFTDRLGLEILDEPCGIQSDPTLLHMKLRSVSTSNTSKSMPPPAISKSSKDIEKWIHEVQALHANQPYPTVSHTKPMPDIDALMIEWPTKMENILNTVGFPKAQLNCSLPFYIDLMCSLLDVPLPPAKTQTDYLLALSTIFNLYLAIKNPME